MSGQITDPKQALTFILGGKATVTLVSLASGNRYTYKITEADKRNPNDAPVYYVSLLNGPDNWTNYAYIGMIKNNQFAWTAKSKVSKDAPSFIGFNFCFNKLTAGSMVGFEVWHMGKCGRCNRPLTVPESIASGFGPECITLLGASAIAASPVIAGGSVAPAPQRNLNFDGTTRKPRAKKAATQPVAVTGTPAVQKPVGDNDAEIRRRIDDLKSDNPEMYYQDGELDEKQAFNVAYNMFRVKIQEGR